MPFDDKAFAIEQYTEFTLNDVINRGDADTEAGARRFIANQIKNTVFAIQTSQLNKADMDKYIEAAGSPTQSEKAQGSLVYDGATIANFYYDGTSKTYKAERGKGLCFDTVTGKCVTGIHPSWAGDEYIEMAIALESCEKLGVTQIPIKFRSPITSKRLHTFKFKNESGEQAPTGAVMSQKGIEIIDGTPHKVIEKPRQEVYNPPWCVNVGENVENNETGTACYLQDDPGPALYESESTMPSWDEQVGPAPGSWVLKKGFPGFRVEGAVEAHMIQVCQVVPQILLAYSGVGTINARDDSTNSYGLGSVNIYYQSQSKFFDTGFIIPAFNASKRIVKADRHLHLVNVMGVFWQINFEDCGVS